MSWGKRADTAAITQLAAALSQKYKVAIKFHHGGEATHTDASKKEISVDLSTAFQHGEDYTVGLILHEVAHVRHSPANIPILDPKHKQASAQIYNWFEDRRIDGLMADEYGGAEQFQAALAKPHLSYVENMLTRLSTTDEQTQVDNAYMAALGYATLEALGGDVRYAFTPVDGKNRKLLTDTYKGITAKSTHTQVREAAVQVLALLHQWLPPDPLEGSTGACQHLQMGGTGFVGEPQQQYNNEYVVADEQAREGVEGLKRKLIAKLRDTERQRFEGGLKRGRLDKKRLARVAYKNYRVYRKRIEPKGKKYAFGVVLDISGSMFDGRAAQMGMKSTAMILRAVRGLGFTASLSVFSNSGAAVLAHTDRYSPTDIAARMSATGFYGGGSDGIVYGITEGLAALKKQSGKKVLVVITDGGLTSLSIPQGKKLIEDAAKKGVSTIIYYVEANLNRILEDETREKTITDPAKLIPATLELLKTIEV